MNGKFLLDTNVVIDFLNGRPGLESLGDSLTATEHFTSVITRMELLSFGRLTAEAEKLVKDFLANLTVISLDDKIEYAAIALRRATRLKLPDAIVAATAWAGGLTLLTSDQQMLNQNWPGLEIRSPLPKSWLIGDLLDDITVGGDSDLSLFRTEKIESSVEKVSGSEETEGAILRLLAESPLFENDLSLT